ncbi:MAG: glycosyltransferase [Candidatus Micrarchaeota archaeon]
MQTGLARMPRMFSRQAKTQMRRVLRLLSPQPKERPLTHVSEKNLRIAFFTDTYLPNVDGVVNAMRTYRTELEKRGDSVCIMASGSSRDAAENQDPGVFFFSSVAFPPYPQYKIALFPLNATSIVEKQRVQIVHSHAIASMGVAAIAAAKLRKLPLVGTFHTMAPKAGFLIMRGEIAESIFSAMTWRAIREFYRPYDLVTAPTETIRSQLEANGVKNTTVVPNGLDIDKFSPKVDGRLVRRMLSIPDNEKIVLSAGRLSEEKNVDVIIKAAVSVLKHEKARFLITGDGPVKIKLMKLAKKLGIADQLMFPGFVKDYEVPFFYACADVFVTASTFETQGLALLEAMSTGKVCIGADALAIPEVISSGKDGFLFEPFNATDLAGKITDVLRMKGAQKARIGREARKVASQFSVQKSTDKLVAAYKSVL